MPKTKPPAKKRAAKKAARPLSRQELLERDCWHFDRDHPTFAAICKIYKAHPGLVYDNWEPWVSMRPNCPLDVKILAAGGRKKPVPYHDWLWPMGRLYTEGGSGEIERQANSIIAHMYGIAYMELIQLDGRRGAWALQDRKPALKPSEALLAMFRDQYGRVVEGLANPRFGNRKPCKPRRSFERMMRDCGFNKRFLDQLDREVERQQARVTKGLPVDKSALSPKRSRKTTPTPRSKQCTPSTSNSRTRTRPSPGSSQRKASAPSPTTRASGTATSRSATGPTSSSRREATRARGSSSRAAIARSRSGSPMSRSSKRSAPVAA